MRIFTFVQFVIDVMEAGSIMVKDTSIRFTVVTSCPPSYIKNRNIVLLRSKQRWYYYAEEIANHYSDDLAKHRRQKPPKIIPITNNFKPNPLPEKYVSMKLRYNLESYNFEKFITKYFSNDNE